MLSLCLSCHEDFKESLKKENIFAHKPVVEGKCQGCHSVHYSNERGLLVSSGEVICNSCHANQEDERFVTAHSGIPTKGSDCLGCHEPHASVDKGLVHELMHEPFKKGVCKRCHDKL
jgi:predicted CXXCH cytochrome family protein